MLEACSFEPLLSFILTYAAPWQHSTERHLTFTTHILIRFGYQTAIRAPRFIQLRSQSLTKTAAQITAGVTLWRTNVLLIHKPYYDH